MGKFCELISYFILLSACESAKTPRPQVLRVVIDSSNALAVLSKIDGSIGSGKVLDGFELMKGTQILVAKGKQKEADFNYEKYAKALENCAAQKCEDSGFLKFADVKKKQTEIRNFMNKLSTNQALWTNLVSERISGHIPQNMEIKKNFFPVRLVLGGRSDGYVENIDGKMELAIDVRTVLQPTIEATEKNFWALLDHEVWHLVFLKYIKENWKVSNPLGVNDSSYQLLFTILNEGYGHYLSILAYSNWDEKKCDEMVSKIVSLSQNMFGSQEFWFDKKIAEFLKLNPQAQKEFIETSHIGEKMQGKFGAVAGMKMISELRKKIGGEETVNLLQNNSFELFEKYLKLENAEFKLGESFKTLVEKAKEGI